HPADGGGGGRDPGRQLRFRRHRIRQSRRGPLSGSGSLRPRSPRRRPPVLRLRPALLPRLPPGEARDRDRAGRVARSPAGPPPRFLRPGTPHHGTRLPLAPVAPRALRLAGARSAGRRGHLPYRRGARIVPGAAMTAFASMGFSKMLKETNSVVMVV